MSRILKMETASRHDCCNTCGAVNYKSELSPRTPRVDHLTTLSIGRRNSAITVALCDECMRMLKDLTDAAVSDADKRAAADDA